MERADPTIPGLSPPNPAVVARLLLTVLFLPVAGLARTWDLRSYTGTMLGILTGRERAYSQLCWLLGSSVREIDVYRMI